MQVVFDSLSRCFGAPNDVSDTQGLQGINTLGAQPLGASKSRRTQSNDQQDQQLQQNNQQPNSQLKHTGIISQQNQQQTRNSQNNSNQEQQLDKRRRGSSRLQDPEWKALFKTVPQHQRSSSCCYSAAANPLEDVQHNSRNKHSEHDHYGNGRSSSSFASNSFGHKDKLQKARQTSNKRKLDIFRSEPKDKRSNPPSSSFASRFLGSESSFNTGAILCFANPIFDSGDDDLTLFRDNNDGDDTITSTLFFDAKYEHVVENGPPIPLYPDQAVPLSEEHDDEIIKIFKAGSIDHQIKSIYCSSRIDVRHNVNAAGGNGKILMPQKIMEVGSKSMADSSNDESSYTGEDYSTTASGKHTTNNSSTAGSIPSSRQQEHDETSTVKSASVIGPLPYFAKTRHNELGIISVATPNSSSEGLPSLKLMSKSSASTQALTPTPSSSDPNLSPKFIKYLDFEGHVVHGDLNEALCTINNDEGRCIGEI